MMETRDFPHLRHSAKGGLWHPWNPISRVIIRPEPYIRLRDTSKPWHESRAAA